MRNLPRRSLVPLLIALAVGAVCWWVLLPIWRFVSPHFLPLSEVLRRANHVTIQPVGHRTFSPVRLSAYDHPRVLAWLSASSAHPCPPPREKPDFTMYVNIRGATVATWKCGYVSATGQFGRGKEWYQVPSEFEAWLLALKSTTPARAEPAVPESEDGEPVVVSAPKSGRS